MGTFYGYTDPDGKHHFLALPNLERAQAFLSSYLNRVPEKVRNTYSGVAIFSYTVRRSQITNDYLHPDIDTLLEHALSPTADRNAIVSSINKLTDKHTGHAHKKKARNEAKDELDRYLNELFQQGSIIVPLYVELDARRRNLRAVFKVREPEIDIVCRVEVGNGVA